MTMLSKLALAAAVATTLFAGPVLAQSFDPDLGTGNLVPFQYAPIATPRVAAAPHANKTAHRASRAMARQRGIDAFAMAPGAQPGLDSNDPALTGGGSLGYNRMLLVH